MSNNDLGGRLRLLFPADLSEDQKKIYEGLMQTIVPEAEKGGFVARLDDGRFIGPFNALLRVPQIAGALGPWTAQIARSGLAEDVRQVVILAVGTAWGAEYEIAAHKSAARVAGVPDAAIEAITSRAEPTGLSAEAIVAYRLTLSLLERHSVDDDLYQEAIDTFGEGGIIAILSLIAQYQLVSSILTCFQIPTP